MAGGKTDPHALSKTRRGGGLTRQGRRRFDHAGWQDHGQSPQGRRHRVQSRQSQPFRGTGQGRTGRHHAGAEIAALYAAARWKAWACPAILGCEIREASMLKRLLLASVFAGACTPAFSAATLDPTHAIGLMPDQIQWKKGEASDTAWPIGDPKTPGACLEL